MIRFLRYSSFFLYCDVFCFAKIDKKIQQPNFFVRFVTPVPYFVLY